MKNEVLLINAPSRQGKGGFMIPLGLLYVASIFETRGWRVQIHDPYVNDESLDQFDRGDYAEISRLVDEVQPAMVGFGGIVTSYPRTKRLSLFLKKRYPQIMQIAGGPLSSVADLLLTRTAVDCVFHGETERSLPLFLEEVSVKGDLAKVPGISFLCDGTLTTTPPPQQVEDLDLIGLPAYHLVNINDYAVPIEEWINGLETDFRETDTCRAVMENIKDKKYYLPIVSSRGCTHRCSFCYRHVKGIRRHSVGYVIDHLKFLMDRYGINGFQFCDELFNSGEEWVLAFCKKIRSEKLDIMYLVGGARADKINRNILQNLRDTGCVQVNYGQESGSESILKEYRKGVTVRQNIEVTRLTEELGIRSTVQLVIGSPGETSATISETIQFLKDLGCRQYSLNYLLPFPQTPIWQYVQEKNLIPDLERYLETVANEGGGTVVNLTRVSDREWESWRGRIALEMAIYHKLGFSLPLPLGSPRLVNLLRWGRRIFEKFRTGH